MQDVQHALKPDCIGRPVGIAVKVVPYLKNPTQPFEGFGIARVIAELSLEKSLADFDPHGGRECPEVLSA